MRLVGRVHSHRLDDVNQYEMGDVVRCECGKEFVRTLKGQHNEPTWGDVGDVAVEYDTPSGPVIGRYKPEYPEIQDTYEEETDGTVDDSTGYDIRSTSDHSEGSESGSGEASSGPA